MRLKLIKSVIALAAVMLLTSCSCDGVMSAAKKIAEKIGDAAEEQNEKNGNISPTKYAVQTFNEVLELVEAKDCQAIFDMFSEYNRENVDLMPEIEKLVNFLDGEVAEIVHVGASNQYGSVRDGVTVSACYSASADIKSDKGTLYWFRVGVITTDEDDAKLGLDWIYVLNCDISSAHTDAWVEWNNRRINGAEEEEPPIPDNMKIRVGA